MKYRKLKTPPHVPHWVRYNYQDQAKTTMELVRFVKGAPRVIYTQGCRVIHDMIALGLKPEVALNAVRNGGHPNSREVNEALVRAFIEFGGADKFRGMQNFDYLLQHFRVNREISIPVRPLITVLQDGALHAIFLVGWATMPLDQLQTRLMMTILEDAVFSHTDFVDARGTFLSFPRDAAGQRKPLVWHRGDFDLLTDVELNQQLEIYLASVGDAEKILDEQGWQERARPSEERDARESDDPRQGRFDL